MPKVFQDLLRANDQYASSFALGTLQARAARGLAVVTCIDSRIEPLAMLGLAPGDAKILRNAGARVTRDVLRSLVMATNMLGVTRIALVTHTDCAMGKTTDAMVRDVLGERYDERWVEKRTFLTTTDPVARERADLRRIISEPLLPPDTVVGALRYDVVTGRLTEVSPAVRVGDVQPGEQPADADEWTQDE